MGTFTNSEDPDEMQHNAAFHQGQTLFVKVKRIFRHKIQFFKIITLHPLQEEFSIQRVNK